MSGQSSEETLVKDANSPPSSHGSNRSFLDRLAAEAEEDEGSDKVVCPTFCTDCDSDRETDKSESERNPLSLTDGVVAVQCTFPMFNPVTTQSGSLSAVDSCPDRETEYANLPLHVHESCDPMDIPIQVNAVLVEIPPPPPYTLVRGRRMRFLPQRMHLPSSSTTEGAYLSDIYQMQQQPPSHQRDPTKGCCPLLVIPESINVRWFIIVISFIALCCVVVGIVLGALKGMNEFTGDDSLTIALLLIGVGIILLTVSGIAWRLTAKQGGAETSLRSMLGFGSIRPMSPALQSFRRMSTGPFSAYVLRNSMGRGCPGYYYEFQFRPPPPSYHASVTDYRTHTDRNGECPTRTPPPNYGSAIQSLPDPLPLLNQIHHLPAINELSQAQVPPCSAPPSYHRRESLGRQPDRPSLGHINTIFNENYCSGTENNCPNAGFIGSGSSSSSKRCASDNTEFLAHL